MRAEEFIRALPKAELHLHLEGALPWEMVRGHAPAPRTPPWRAEAYRFESFSRFAAVMRQCYEPVLTAPSRYHAAARAIFRGLTAQNVRYVEVSYSLGHAVAAGLPQHEIVDAIRQAVPSGLTVRLFCGLSRSRPVRAQEEALASLLDREGLDGLDLHGDENARPASAFAELFHEAGRRGLMLKAHAGEMAGPASIRETMRTLRVGRIEHGVTAVADDGLVAELAAAAVTLDMCPTSNVKLRVVEDFAAHPIGSLHRRGVRVTVSTDNPTILGCALTGELERLHGSLGFGLHDLVQVQRSAFQAARIPESVRGAVLAELNAFQVRAEARGSHPDSASSVRLRQNTLRAL